MSKYFLKESQLKKIVETGSNSAAMDLDIYVQPVHHDTSNGNENIEDTIKDIVSILDELKNTLHAGKKIPFEQKGKFFKILDDLKRLHRDSTEM